MIEINSFDCFDTLIGRKCYKPEELFKRVGLEVGMNDFLDKRRTAERFFQEKLIPYSLQDIYDQLGEPSWAKIEWRHEQENAFMIKRYAMFLRAEDIVVSDMYLDEDQIRELLRIAGMDFFGKIYVSPYGKRTGQVWKQIKEDGIQIALHHGDNRTTDIDSAGRAGIRASHVKDVWLNKTEQVYEKGMPQLAWWVREHRLKHILNEGKERLTLFQIQYNVPLLWSICQTLATNMEKGKIEKYLFMARDGQLASYMWQTLFPDKPAEYLYTSRDCLRSESDSYFEYLNSKLTEETSLVDLCASCGSLQVALPRLNVTLPKIFTAIFLAEPFRVDVSKIMCSFITTNTRTRINNTYLEMLNYADHWHVCDVVDGVPVFDLEDEYDMVLVKAYHTVIKDMLLDIPMQRKDDATPVFFYALGEIQKNAALIGNYFPNHIPIEKKRKTQMRFSQPASDDMIVVGAIHNYRWNQIDIWYRSLIATGFTGQIHMMCYRIDPTTLRKMERNGIIPHIFELKHPQVVIDRFRDLPKVLKTFREDQWVLFPDVGDIAFQYNPAHYLNGIFHYDFVVTHEGVRFENNRWTDRNLRESYPEYYETMKPKYFINAGSIAGRAGAFAKLSQSIYNMCLEAQPESKSHDQAAANILLQLTPHYINKTLVLTPDDPWCFCGASSIFAEQEDSQGYEFAPPSISAGICYVGPAGQKTCMFHHYPRNRRVARDVIQTVHDRYRRRR